MCIALCITPDSYPHDTWAIFDRHCDGPLCQPLLSDISFDYFAWIGLWLFPRYETPIVSFVP